MTIVKREILIKKKPSAKLRKDTKKIGSDVLIKKVVPKSKHMAIAKGHIIKFKAVETGRIIKPSPVVPSVGAKRIRAAVASVIKQHS